MLRILITPLLLAVATAATGQIKNGFDLGDSLIDPSEIRLGGPPRDGIPSIDAPKFVAAADATFLNADDRVIGVQRNGVAKAYAIRILNWHEIVNDDFDGAATLVTYCPLCGTGMVFDIDNELDFEFGVSGLLYNSDVLLYDRASGSLWSQILGQAISGPMKGVDLPLLPSRHTTWADWRATHPDSLVLSLDTGFSRDYSSTPYLSYERNDRIMFPVAHRSREYANKALVLGVTIDGTARAYPLEELEQHGRPRFRDELAGRDVWIVWSETARSAHILDESGNEIPSVLAYWFAWYGFHPDTEVFRADERGQAELTGQRPRPF